jgi:predicted transcriptional regulator
VSVTMVPEEFAEIAELHQRWDAIAAGEATVDHEEVVRWLKSWGTPAFKAWKLRER